MRELFFPQTFHRLKEVRLVPWTWSIRFSLGIAFILSLGIWDVCRSIEDGLQSERSEHGVRTLVFLCGKKLGHGLLQCGLGHPLRTVLPAPHKLFVTPEGGSQAVKVLCWKNSCTQS